MAKSFYVYILASRTRVLYTGFTSNLAKRMAEHQAKSVPGFTADYNVNRLVYVERLDNPRVAITREKQIKAWRREKKVALIEAMNPEWSDLADTIVLS